MSARATTDGGTSAALIFPLAAGSDIAVRPWSLRTETTTPVDVIAS